MTDRLDCFGAPVRCEAEALDGINDFVDGFVRYRPSAVNVLETADAMSECALANIYAGFLWMFLERPEAPDKAAPYLQRACACTNLNERECSLRDLLAAWQRYDIGRVVQISEHILDSYPQDLATLKLAQYHLFNSADSPGMLRVAMKCRQTNAEQAPLHSMLAFAHEQCHHIDDAERAAMHALSLDEAEPWAHHALAHVHLTRGNISIGKRFLQSMAPAWSGLNSFMFTHNWWHLAVFEIAEGQVDSALAIYDERCWGVEPDYSQDQIGAVSLLARLECAGHDVGDRWQALRPYLEARNQDVVQPFLTLQYLYGLARSESSEADELMQLIRQQAVRAVVPQDQALWQNVGIPAAEGVLAHANGNHARATALLATVQTRLWQVGGSHAQRDLFEQLLLDALLKSDQWVAAQQMLEVRRQWEPESPILEAKLADVYAHLGLRSWH